ncbi:molybdate ABC transporter substrate-binding protein [Nocardioides terrigena]|uniref:molybdate ABC transporter substrate-binding protein n=1 Tax=Nocardioides terrigena TaxID=424797 RepID=UPI000D2F612C|nr:molybdate ABC transporter substrate-binding protein [Nocardioides terrigena]
MRRPSRAVLVAGLAVALVAIIVTVVAVVRSVSGPEKTIEVYAASSLRHAFPEIAVAFEDEEDVAVDFTFGSSSPLVAELSAGATPDVLAVADGVALSYASPVLVGEPLVFTQNRLVLVVPEGNPAGVQGVEDLDGVRVAICDINAPCGRLAQAALLTRGQEVQPVVGIDAATTLQLVLDGSAEAGLVYATDALSVEDDVDVVELPGAEDRVGFYGISLLTGATAPEEGQAFIDFVLSEDGQDILEEHGFLSADNPHLQPED